MRRLYESKAAGTVNCLVKFGVGGGVLNVQLCKEKCFLSMSTVDEISLPYMVLYSIDINKMTLGRIFVLIMSYSPRKREKN